MWHHVPMTKMIQVRNVPDGLHSELTRRAKRKRQTLSSYIQQILEREVSRPVPEEVFERIERRTPVNLGASAAELIRQERADREATH